MNHFLLYVDCPYKKFRAVLLKLDQKTVIKRKITGKSVIPHSSSALKKMTVRQYKTKPNWAMHWVLPELLYILEKVLVKKEDVLYIKVNNKLFFSNLEVTYNVKYEEIM